MYRCLTVPVIPQKGYFDEKLLPDTKLTEDIPQ